MFGRGGAVARLECEVHYLNDQVDELRRERDYWKAKTEHLLDMALFKRGEITAPVFEERKVAPAANPMLQVLGAMTTMVTDSSKRASTAAPVTPMP